MHHCIRCDNYMINTLKNKKNHNHLGILYGYRLQVHAIKLLLTEQLLVTWQLKFHGQRSIKALIGDERRQPGLRAFRILLYINPGFSTYYDMLCLVWLDKTDGKLRQKRRLVGVDW